MERPIAPQETKEQLTHYSTVIVAPSYESATHLSGLFWDTRLRLLATSMLYESGATKRIIVGGARIRNMHNSFATLMQRELIEQYKIPESAIEQEEQTFDTASQVEWTQNHRDQVGANAAFITDPEQKRHFQALLQGYNLNHITVLSTEDIILQYAKDSRHFERFFKKLHRSPYWLKWKGREALLTLLAKTVDPTGERIRTLTQRKR